MSRDGVRVPGARHSATAAFARASLLAALLIAAGATTAAGQPAPVAALPASVPAADALVHTAEVGAGWGGYDNGLGRADDQFLRYRLSRANDFRLGLDAGREQRFGETSFGGGASITKWLSTKTSVSAGVGSGTGQVLAPQYRLDVGATHAVGDILLSAGYTRRQSRAVNSSDGVSVGAVRYLGQWIVGGNTRVDVGTPGRVVSTSVGGSLTWYRWKRLYVGGDLSWGDVAYQLLPDRAAVGYRSLAGGLAVSRWFDARSGVNVRANLGNTDLYRTGGLVVSVFRDF